jgi:hypothetical protein
MRRAILAGQPYVIERPKRVELDGGLQVLADETEAVRFSGRELIEAYGGLCSYTLARVAAYCEPTWWLGRNFWVGLLLTARFGIRGLFGVRRPRHVQELIAQHSASPAAVLEEIAVPGFGAGMPELCEGYSTGLYFAPTVITALLASLRSDGDAWATLAREVTGYPPEGTRQLLQMVEEAFVWAESNSVGLIEADEVVGAYGYR